MDCNCILYVHIFLELPIEKMLQLELILFSYRRIYYAVAIGPAISHVRTCHTGDAEVTVSVVSTTVQLTVESSIDLATVGRTTMEAIIVVSHSRTSFAAVWLRETRWRLGNDDSIETP